MDTYLSNNQNCTNSFDAPPILIVADSESSAARARTTVAKAGLRVAESIGVERAVDRIGQQISASALWIELENDLGSATQALLDRVAKDVGEQRYKAIVSIRSAHVEAIARHAFDPDIDFIVDGGEAERSGALAVALVHNGEAFALHEATTDKNAARLRQLSDEVSRIAASLARLSTGPGSSVRPAEMMPFSDAPPVSVERVAATIRARRARSRYFREDLFADPAWDMLLDLFQSEISNHRVPVSSLCIAASVPATTALRWLKSMVQEGLFVRRADPHDGRRVFVELAPKTSQAMRAYFAEVGETVVI